MDDGGDGRVHRSQLPAHLPAEYDDLYMENGPYPGQQSFSLDINKRMKVPNRLSVDGKNLHDLEVENMRANTSDSRFSVAQMAVPDKITVSGAGSRNPTQDPYDLMNASAENSGYVNISTPPRVLTVDERFPQLDIDEEEEALQEYSQTEDLSVLPMGDTLPKQVATPADTGIRSLQQRVSDLEQRQRRLESYNLVTYPLLALYFLYKIFSWAVNK